MASVFQRSFSAGGYCGQREDSSSFTAAHCQQSKLSAPESYRLYHQALRCIMPECMIS